MHLGKKTKVAYLAFGGPKWYPKWCRKSHPEPPTYRNHASPRHCFLALVNWSSSSSWCLGARHEMSGMREKQTTSNGVETCHRACVWHVVGNGLLQQYHARLSSPRNSDLNPAMMPVVLTSVILFSAILSTSSISRARLFSLRWTMSWRVQQL